MTAESRNDLPRLNLLLVDNVADAKRTMNLRSADILPGNGHVVIALPWPRMGFTTDATIVRRWDLRRQAAFNELAELAASLSRTPLSRTPGRTYTMVELPYRWSRHPTIREERVDVALNRVVAAMPSGKPCPHPSPGLDDRIRPANTSIALWPPEASDSLVITTLSEGVQHLVSVCPGPCCVRADGGSAARQPDRGSLGRVQGICAGNPALRPCAVGL